MPERLLPARILDFVRDPMALFDASGRITEANGAFRDLASGAGGEAVGRGAPEVLRDLFGASVDRDVARSMSEAFSGEEDAGFKAVLGRNEYDVRIRALAPGDRRGVLSVAGNEEAGYEATLYKLFKEKEGYRKRLEAVFNSVPDHIVGVDARLRVIMANRLEHPFCPSMGRLALGKPFGSAGCCEEDACLRVLQKTVATRKEVLGYQTRCGCDGLDRVIELSSAPLWQDGEHFSGAVLVARDVTRLAVLERSAKRRRGMHNIIGDSPSMQDIFHRIEQLKDLNITVLVTGESGTGKELVAEALHHEGGRSKAPLVKVNCSALAESLLESELFGHVKGAFTGAVNNRVGRIQAAEGGTLFLDEVGELSPALQVKLLRFLEKKEYEPVGDSQTRTADVRLVAATNADLAKLVGEGRFREDLYYRLNVFSISLPPLRERGSDVALLAGHFIDLCNRDFMKGIRGLTPAALALLAGHSWPGNVRELRHAVEHACVVCPGSELGVGHFPETLRSRAPEPSPSVAGDDESERGRILAALERAGGNRSRAAKILGIHRATLYRKLSSLGLG